MPPHPFTDNDSASSSAMSKNITYVSNLNNTTVYNTTQRMTHRQALQHAIDGGYIKQPGIYAVAKPGSGRLSLMTYRVREVRNPSFEIEDCHRDEIE